MLERGWTFANPPGVVPDPVNHAQFLHEAYTAAEPATPAVSRFRYSGTSASVPLLTDDLQIGANLRVCADEEDRADIDQHS